MLGISFLCAIAALVWSALNSAVTHNDSSLLARLHQTLGEQQMRITRLESQLRDALRRLDLFEQTSQKIDLVSPVERPTPPHPTNSAANIPPMPAPISPVVAPKMQPPAQAVDDEDEDEETIPAAAFEVREEPPAQSRITTAQTPATPPRPAPPPPAPATAAPRDVPASTRSTPVPHLSIFTPSESIASKPAAPVPASTFPPAATKQRSPTAPSEPINWEKMFFKALPILGAIALAGAGLFGVKVMNNHGYFGPTVRIVLATLAGLGAIGAAQFLRLKQARIAEALAAAGVVTLYAADLAAHGLYHMIPTTAAFAGIALITAAAVVLSLRHGQLVALLGLVGGFLTPALLHTGRPLAADFFGYLFLLQVGLAILTRGKRWWWLTGLAMVGGLVWAGIWIAIFFNPEQAHFIGLFLLATIVAFVVATIDATENDTLAGIGVARAIPWAAVTVGLALVTWLLGLAGFSNFEWAMLGVIGLGAILLARIHPRYIGMPWLVLGTCLLMLFAWGLQIRPGDMASAARLAWISLAMGALFSAAPYAALWNAKHPTHWALMSLAASVGFLISAWSGVGDSLTGHMPPWWAIAGVLAALHALAALPIHLRRDKTAQGDDLLASFVVGSTLLMSWAVVLLADQYNVPRQWVSIAWALEVFALACCAGWLRLPKLDQVAIVVSLAVAVRLLVNPFLLTQYDFGTGPIAWWLLYGYGIPIALFIGASLLIRPRSEPTSDWLESLAAAMAGMMFTLGIRHYFHPQHLTQPALSLDEVGSYASAFIMLAMLFAATASRYAHAVLHVGARILFALGVAVIFLGGALLTNPLWADQPVGQHLIFNVIFFAFGIPAVLCAAATRTFQRPGDSVMSIVAQTCAALLALICTGLLVHHGYNGENMHAPARTLAEQGTLSVTWLTLGLAALVAGQLIKRPSLETTGAATVYFALASSTLGLCLIANPIFTSQSLGSTPVFNLLLYAFGVPTLLFAVIAWRLHHSQKLVGTWITGLASAFFATITTAMLIHHGFHAGQMSQPVTSIFEYATYTAAWLGIGTALLALWKWRGSELLESAAVMFLYLGTVVLTIGCGLASNPLWTTQNIGETPVFNGLLYALGLPLLLFSITAWIYQSAGKHARRDAALLVVCVLSFLLVGMEVHHAFHTTSMRNFSISLLQHATHAVTWAGLAFAFFAAARRQPIIWFELAARVGVVLFSISIVLGVCLLENPLWVHTSVGSMKVFNWLLYTFALPALLAATGSFGAGKIGLPMLRKYLGTLALALAFAFVTLEVRQWFQGSFLDTGDVSAAELYCYSAVWIVFGIFLVTLGIYTRSKAVRIASMVVMLAAMGKVFVYDTRHLEDLWRVVSYMGLGLSLLGLFWAYRKWVFPPLETPLDLNAEESKENEPQKNSGQE